MPTGTDVEMQRAGILWDGVKAPAWAGDRVLARLGERSGAVLRDPWSDTLYWLIRPGAADGWRLPHVTVLGVACYVAVPPVHRTNGLGPHWAVPPDHDRQLTDPALLHEALAYAVGAAYGGQDAR
ncbi:hypothetical protein [Streptomyces armeniacus]|uniref:hypothetical protein n=1 Tax=Streptomyces armeniacus TaxID=83291 RepID=UPI001AD7F1F6|nr:hypothetical protein [Streptomyces armeniacus]